MFFNYTFWELNEILNEAKVSVLVHLTEKHSEWFKAEHIYIKKVLDALSTSEAKK